MDFSRGGTPAMFAVSLASAVACGTVVATYITKRLYSDLLLRTGIDTESGKAQTQKQLAALSYRDDALLYVFISLGLAALGSLPGEPAAGSGACWFEGLVSRAFTLAAAGWVLLMCVQLFAVVVLRRVVHLSWHLHLVMWPLPVAVTLLPLITATYAPPATADGLGWCWVVQQADPSPAGRTYLWFFLSFHAWLLGALAAMATALLVARRTFFGGTGVHKESKRRFHAAFQAIVGYPVVLAVCWGGQFAVEVVTHLYAVSGPGTAAVTTPVATAVYPPPPLAATNATEVVSAHAAGVAAASVPAGVRVAMATMACATGLLAALWYWATHGTEFHHVWAAYHKKLNAKPLSFYLKNVEVGDNDSLMMKILEGGELKSKRRRQDEADNLPSGAPSLPDGWPAQRRFSNPNGLPPEVAAELAAAAAAIALEGGSQRTTDGPSPSVRQGGRVPRPTKAVTTRYAKGQSAPRLPPPAGGGPGAPRRGGQDAGDEGDVEDGEGRPDDLDNDNEEGDGEVAYVRSRRLPGGGGAGDNGGSRSWHAQFSMGAAALIPESEFPLAHLAGVGSHLQLAGLEGLLDSLHGGMSGKGHRSPGQGPYSGSGGVGASGSRKEGPIDGGLSGKAYQAASPPQRLLSPGGRHGDGDGVGLPIDGDGDTAGVGTGGSLMHATTATPSGSDPTNPLHSSSTTAAATTNLPSTTAAADLASSHKQQHLLPPVDSPTLSATSAVSFSSRGPLEPQTSNGFKTSLGGAAAQTGVAVEHPNPYHRIVSDRALKTAIATATAAAAAAAAGAPGTAAKPSSSNSSSGSQHVARDRWWNGSSHKTQRAAVEHAVGALLRPFQPQLQHKQGSDIDPNRSSVKVSGAETGAVAPTRRSLGGTSFFRGGGAGAGAGATARVAAGDGTIDPASKDGGEGEDEEGRRRERQLQTLRRASIQYLKNMATRDEAPDDRGPAPAGRATATPSPAAAAEAAAAAPSRAATEPS